MSSPHDLSWALATAARLAREAEQARIINLLETSLVAFCPCSICRHTKELIQKIKGEE
jgi:hypothetical protein